MDSINHFYKKSKEFTLFLSENKRFELNNCKNYILNLLDIYSLALELPDVEPDTDFVKDIKIDDLYINFGEFDAYWETYNPKECDEAVCGSLTDDFFSIYKELKVGILLFEQNEFNEAIWHWKWSFENHWSYHAVDALRALNNIVFI